MPFSLYHPNCLECPFFCLDFISSELARNCCNQELTVYPQVLCLDEIISRELGEGAGRVLSHREGEESRACGSLGFRDFTHGFSNA